MVNSFAIRSLTILVAALFLGMSAVADIAQVKLEDQFEKQDLLNYLAVFEDQEGSRSIEDILLVDKYGLFKSLETNQTNIGYSTSAFWMKFTVKKSIADDKTYSDLWVKLRDSRFDYVDVYTKNQHHTEKAFSFGAALPFNKRPITDRNLIFPLQMDDHEIVVYVRIKSSTPIYLGGTLWRNDAYLYSEKTVTAIESAYFAVLLVMIIYNLFLYLRVGDMSHLHYVIYVVCFGGLMASIMGYGHQYFWPNLGDLNSKSAALFCLAVGIFGGVFSRSYLQIRKFMPQADNAILILMLVSFVVGVFVLLGPLKVREFAIAYTIIISSIILYIGTKRFLQGSRMAGFYMIGWGCLVISGFMHLGVVQLNLVAMESPILIPMFGSIFEMIIFSLGMADRINSERMAKHTALSLQNVATFELEKANTKLHTQAKELEMALKMSHKHNRLKEEFLCSVSHELRTPIHAITGSLEFFNPSELSKENKEHFKAIENSSNQLLSLVDDILNFSEEEQQLNRQEIDLIQIITHSIQLLLPRSRGIQWEIAEDSAPIPREMIGDKERITQIVFNLLSNALKYGKDNIRVGLYHQSLENEHEILFEVWNDGEVIEKERRQEIFEPFTQGSGGYGRSRGGLGIGLAVCKKMAELMGGAIHLSSSAQSGTKFTVRIPFGKTDNDESRELQSHPIVRLIKEKGRRVEGHAKMDMLGDLPLKVKQPEVLIVEDNAVNRRILKKMVLSLGYRVTEAKDGHEGFILATKKQYAAILMDCQMPFMDGFITTENIRKLCSWGHQIPIIAITANVLEEDRQKCLLAGMNDFLPKPARLEDIKDCLTRWVYN